MTRRGNGDGSVYQRSNGQWVASISVKTISGDRKRRTRNAKSKEHARLLLHELRQQYRHRSDNPVSLSVRDLLDRWFKTIEGSRATSTVDQHRRAKNRIVKVLGNRKVKDLNPLLIEDWLESLVAENVGGRTQQQTFGALRAALNYAVKMQIVDSNPCVVVPGPKHSREEIRPFTAEQVESILEVTSRNRYAALYQLAFTTGMRQGELFGLQWRDLLPSGQLKIQRQAREYSGNIEVKPPKTTAGKRTVQLTERTQQLINELPRPMKLDAFIFTSPNGTVIRRNNFRKRQWTPLLKSLEIDHRGFHHVRHTAATMMLRQGVPPLIVSKVLGHSKVSTTQDIYGHYIPEDSSQAAAAMSNLGIKHG